MANAFLHIYTQMDETAVQTARLEAKTQEQEYKLAPPGKAFLWPPFFQ